MLRPAFIKITAYHLVACAFFILLLTENPGIGEYFPLGTGEKLFSTPSSIQQLEPIHAGRLEGTRPLARGLFLFICFLSSVGVSVPVAWAYLETRGGKKKDPTFAQAILLLPIAVTGLVLIVQNSLALAFALAGVVAGAGIRFRANIREVVDTLFFLIAIAIGIASGVGSLGLALIMSIVFTYTLLITSAIGFGGVNQASAKGSSKSGEHEPSTPTG